MIRFHDTNNGQKIAEIPADFSIKKIKSVEDAMDFWGDLYVNDCSKVAMHKDALDDSFFDLKTGLAGDILQKFSTYNIKLAIIGDFSNVKSKSLRDFIRESNRQKFINFVSSLEEAIEVLKD